MDCERSPIFGSQKFPDPVGHTIWLSPKNDSYKGPENLDIEPLLIQDSSAIAQTRRAKLAGSAFAGSAAAAPVDAYARKPERVGFRPTNVVARSFWIF